MAGNPVHQLYRIGRADILAHPAALAASILDVEFFINGIEPAMFQAFAAGDAFGRILICHFQALELHCLPDIWGEDEVEIGGVDIAIRQHGIFGQDAKAAVMVVFPVPPFPLMTVICFNDSPLLKFCCKVERSIPSIPASPG